MNSVTSFVIATMLIGLTPAFAEVTPSPGARDAQIQTVDYDSEQVVRLATAPGYVLVVELSSDERIETMAMGTTDAWQVTANRRGNLLFIKQGQGAAPTNLSVISDARRYTFSLVPGYGPDSATPYSVKIRYPGIDTAPQLAVEEKPRRYRISGPRALKPIAMSDDGQATSIRWTNSSSLPAIYAVSSSGEESIVNGQMRGDAYVVDAIAPRFRFRLGKASATATRLPPEKRR